jgi:alpha-N-arabinofuranosidase
MDNFNRRKFIGGALALGALALTKNVARANSSTNFDINSIMPSLLQSTRALESRIDVLIKEPIATINPDIYGHFVEHLGGVVYDGIWVGENSRIPNTGGIRTALVEAMKRIKPSVIRYPGGCFADSYDWRDGIGERAKRPRRTNFWVDDPTSPVRGQNVPQNYEPNTFGTNEFMRFCQMTGGKPYLAANLRALGAQDFYQWVEYCNSPAGTTTGAETRASGEMPSRDPFKVEYWGVGNESWGCGGNLTPEEYAAEFRRFTAAVPLYGVPLKYIASGANGDDLNWTRGFFSKTREKSEGIFGHIYGFGLHHYSWNVSMGKTNDWFAGKGDAVNYNTAEYYELLHEADRMEGLINRHWTVMGEYDRPHRTKLIVDEWGAWYKPGTEQAPAHLLGQQSTMRDALLAGLTLDTFNRHADKVAMANVAQLINCLHSPFLAHEDKFTVTPTYHVFELYAAHQGAQAVRAEFVSPRATYTRNDKPADFWSLGGSASIKDKQVTLTVVNTDISAPRETEISVGGARIASVNARVLSTSDVHAHNTFENPRAVEPRDEKVNVNGGRLVYRFAPASVTRLQITLA